MVTTDDIVARARAALEGITPGPWRHCRGSSSAPPIMVDQNGTGMGLRVAVEDMMEEDGVDPGDIRGWIRDATFIAQSPELVRELADEVERLRRWKGEAAEVLIGLQDLGRELNVPSGRRITGEGASEAARTIVGERDRLAATVERVRELSMQVHGPAKSGDPS